MTLPLKLPVVAVATPVTTAPLGFVCALIFAPPSEAPLTSMAPSP